MTATRSTTCRRSRLRLPALILAALAAAGFLAACGSSKDSAETTTTSSSQSGNPDQPQQITVGDYTFTMKPQTAPTDIPFPEGTFTEVQGFEISKDASTIMTAYSTTLPTGQTADASTVDKLLSAAAATDPTPGDVQGQPFTSATLPDGRILILAVADNQVAIAIGQDRDQMVKALSETSQAQPPGQGQPPPN